MKVALVYDRVNKIGGAEQVLQNLHEIWPDAPLYTSVYDPAGAPWASKFTIITSFLNKIPFFRKHHELLPILMPYAFESLDLSQFDVVISVTSAEAKGVLTSPNQLHICYLLTPTRYLWSHVEEYAAHNGILKKLLLSLRRWDQVAATRPDKMISISKAVAKRCQKYYHRKSDAIIYPPANINMFSRSINRSIDQTSYLLVVSRLVPYKRVDLAIKACNVLKKNLVVVGTGSEYERLKKAAGPTITFLGQVPDEALPDLYRNAEAFLFPQEEEFGITAIEAQSAGIPVIAYKGGSATEIIIEGRTGIFFENQTVESLVEAISHLNHHTWYDKTIQEHANQFDKKVFQRQFKQFVEEAWQTQYTRG